MTVTIDGSPLIIALIFIAGMFVGAVACVIGFLEGTRKK